MFDQFVREGSDGHFNRENVCLWAREVASSYVADGRPLNEKIAHIAEENGLNGEQIQRIVEAANLAVDALKKGSDFDVATAPAVMRLMKDKIEESPSTTSDYMVPPEGLHRDIDLNDLFGVKPQSEASIPEKKMIQIRIIKLGEAKKSLEDHLFNLNLQKHECENSLMKTAQQCIVGEYEDINDLYAMACEVGCTEQANRYFPIIDSEMVRKQIFEKSAFIAPTDLISKTLQDNGIPNIRIINGNHGMIKSFQTIKKIDDDIVHARKAIVLADSKIQKLKQESQRVS